MRKRYFSVLRICSYKESSYENVIVVCETKNDEKEVLEMARRVGDKVLNISTGEESGIFLNDYEFMNG